jgi:AcrR family transcriptional regulator
VKRKASVDERRIEILEATCDVVIERGFAGTRVKDVADRLGISTGLIHYHFDSKDVLFAEAFRHAASADVEKLRAAVNAADSALDKLDQALAYSTPTEAEPTMMLWIDSWGESLRSPSLRQISQELDDQVTDVVEDVIRLGVSRGDWRCVDPEASAWRLTALLDGLGVQVTVHDDLLSRETMIDWVRGMACSELGLEPNAFASSVRPRSLSQPDTPDTPDTPVTPAQSAATG